MVNSYADPILVVTGLLTVAPIVLVAAPVAGMRSIFGSDARDAYSVTLTRHWGLLVALVGGLLIYAAFHPEVREPIMVAAIIEKLALGALFLTALPRRLPVTLIAVADAVMALIYVYLLLAPHRA